MSAAKSKWCSRRDFRCTLKSGSFCIVSNAWLGRNHSDELISPSDAVADLQALVFASAAGVGVNIRLLGPVQLQHRCTAV